MFLSEYDVAYAFRILMRICSNESYAYDPSVPVPSQI